MTLATIKEKLQELFRNLKKKDSNYWRTVFVLIAVGTVVGDVLSERHTWIELRYKIYQQFEKVTFGNRGPNETTLVLIDDDDYWKGEFARRSPLNRKYLAQLVLKLAEFEPKAIALDIDLRSPVPQNGNVELPEYQEETRCLLEAIKEVSPKRVIILATTLTRDPHSDGHVVNPNVFDGYDFPADRVWEGYTELPEDVRLVPLAVPVKNRPKKEEYSFSEAIARTRAGTGVKFGESFPYGNFFKVKDFATWRLSVRSVLHDDPRTIREKVQGRLVIVGGAWHGGAHKGEDAREDTDEDDREDPVDTHLTPAGRIYGAYVHANYVEALLGNGLRRQIPKPVAIIIEVLCSLLVAVVFALEGSLRTKFGRVILLCIVLVVLSYFLWTNLGFYFDFFIPLFLLSVHAPVEQLRETRKEMRDLRKRLRELEEKDNPPNAEPQL